MNSELTIINVYKDEIVNYLKNRINDLGIENCVYKISKGTKTLVDYDKATYYDLMIQLGLHPIFTEFTQVPVNNQINFSVRVEIQNRINKEYVWSAYGTGSTAESLNWKMGGGLQDTMRMGAIVQIRAVKNALNPILNKLGLDYANMSQLDKKDYKKYVFTPLDSIAEENPKNNITDLQLKNIVEYIKKSDKKNKLNYQREIKSILKNNHKIDEENITIATLKILTQDDYEILKIIMINLE